MVPLNFYIDEIVADEGAQSNTYHKINTNWSYGFSGWENVVIVRK